MNSRFFYTSKLAKQNQGMYDISYVVQIRQPIPQYFPLKKINFGINIQLP